MHRLFDKLGGMYYDARFQFIGKHIHIHEERMSRHDFCINRHYNEQGTDRSLDYYAKEMAVNKIKNYLISYGSRLKWSWEAYFDIKFGEERDPMLGSR